MKFVIESLFLSFSLVKNVKIKSIVWNICHLLMIVALCSTLQLNALVVLVIFYRIYTSFICNEKKLGIQHFIYGGHDSVKVNFKEKLDRQFRTRAYSFEHHEI